MDVMKNANTTTKCSDDIPSAKEFLSHPATRGILILCSLWLCIVLVLSIFVDEIVFFVKKFSLSKNKRRRNSSISVLALPPVFAVTALLGVMVPRAGVLVDLVADSYLPIAMYSLQQLIRDYLGGRRSMEACGVTEIRINTPPCCCCVPCLPRIKFNRRCYLFMTGLVFQTTIVRPCLMFITAVLWVDGSYIPGKVSVVNPFIYLVVLNIMTSLLAVWGLLIIQKNYEAFLQTYRMKLKFVFLQILLLGTALGNMIIGILVSHGMIPCSNILPSASRAQLIYHTYVVILMVFVSLWGRFAFRRADDIPMICLEEDDVSIHSEELLPSSERQDLHVTNSINA